jgi:hypothetical protein
MRNSFVKTITFSAIVAASSAVLSLPLSAQSLRIEGPGLSFHFNDDDRGNVEGKRASCGVYAQIAQVQAEANRKYRCGYGGPRWDPNPEPHFRWCRYVRRETLGAEFRDRAVDLQRCFDRLGDFDDDRWEHHR